MRNTLKLTALFLFFGPMAANAAPLLLGDTIDITFEDPPGSVVEGPLTTTVAAGTSDVVTSNSFFSFPHFDINPEDTSINFDYVAFSTSYGSGTYRISGIDTLLSSVGLTLFGTAMGIDGTAISLVGNDILIDLAGLSINNDSPSGFVVDVVAATVPEPGTLALLGLGLAGMGFARRKKA